MKRVSKISTLKGMIKRSELHTIPLKANNFNRMKKISLILIFTCICSQVLFSNNIENGEPAQLKKGDWFTIEFANRLEDYSAPVDTIDYCAPIDLKQLVLKCEVLEKTNTNMRLDFRIERLLDLKKYGRYYDSYFKTETIKRDKPALQDIVFEVDVNLPKDSIQFLNSSELNFAVYRYVTFSRDVNIKGRFMSFTRHTEKLDLRIVRFMIEDYLNEWQKRNYKVPLLPYGHTEWQKRNYKVSHLTYGRTDVGDFKKYRILESSLPVENNFQLVVNIPDSLADKDLEIYETTLVPFLEYGEKEMFRKNMNKGLNYFNLYLTEQKLLMFRIGVLEKKFIATPNDTLRIDIDAVNNSLVSKYQGDQEYLSLLIKGPKYYRVNPEGLENMNLTDSGIQFLNEETVQLINSLDSFKHELTATFYKKQLLSVYYKVAAGVINWYDNKQISPNYSELNQLLAFQNIYPLSDYIFLPDYYNWYLRSVTYNSFRPDYESVSTNHGFSRSFNWIEGYDVYDVLYWGYPKYFALKNIVISDLEHNGVKSAQENYDKFLINCSYPPLLNEIKEVYARYKRLEPGEPIAGLGLNITKNKHFNGDNEKFRLILFVDQITRNTAIRLGYNIGDVIQSFNLNDKVELYIVSSKEFDRSVMQNIPNSENFETKYINMGESDSLVWKDLNILSMFPGRLFIISPDNKIVGRNITVRLIKESVSEYIEAQNQLKSHENRKAMILGAFISLLGTGFLAWIIIKINNRRIKKRESARRKLSELELKAIRSQMNPHFIFNAMGSIQNLMNHNQTEKANLYLSRFAKLMRMVLNSSNKKLVSLADELELIRLYLELEQLRVDFQFKVEVGESVNPETEEIPGMLLQPFVENAVIHGITSKGEGSIEIEISKAESNLVCSISDDGVGIDPEKTGNGNGLAMKFAEKRVNLLSEQLKTRMKLQVVNRSVSEGKSGTKVTLIIPVE